MRDDLAILQLMGMGIGSSIEVAIVVAFMIIASLYFLAPVVGYQRPTGLAISLYLLIGNIGFTVLQMILQWLQMLDRSNPRGMGRNDEFHMHILVLLGILKIIVFMLAMLSFVIGLQSLRRRPMPSERDLSRD